MLDFVLRLLLVVLVGMATAFVGVITFVVCRELLREYKNRRNRK